MRPAAHAGRREIGILRLDALIPRVRGDIGDPRSFACPVRYKVIAGATPVRAVREADRGLLEAFRVGARELEAEGVAAISTSCGFLVLYQRELAAAASVPIFTSSLLQIPWIRRGLRSDQRVGILTADGRYLTEAHLEGAGVSGKEVAILGAEETEELRRVLFEGKQTIDVGLAEAEMVGLARRLVAQNPDLGAIVLECTDFPPYARPIQEVVGLPVYDLVTMLNWVYDGLARSGSAEGGGT